MGSKPLWISEKQPLQVSVVIGAFFGSHRHLAGIGQVAQGLQAVAQAIDIIVDGKNAQLAASRLGIEAEQDPVDEHQRLVPQMLGGDVPLAVGQGGLRFGEAGVGQLLGAPTVDPAIADLFDRAPDSTLQFS